MCVEQTNNRRAFYGVITNMAARITAHTFIHLWMHNLSLSLSPLVEDVRDLFSLILHHIAIANETERKIMEEAKKNGFRLLFRAYRIANATTALMVVIIMIIISYDFFPSLFPFTEFVLFLFNWHRNAMCVHIRHHYDAYSFAHIIIE